MHTFKVRIVLFEMIDTTFVSLIGLDISCKEEDIEKKIDYITNEIKKFVKENGVK